MGRIALALGLALCLAGSASAECAWVLWITAFKMTGTVTTGEYTSPADAYASKRDC